MRHSSTIALIAVATIGLLLVMLLQPGLATNPGIAALQSSDITETATEIASPTPTNTLVNTATPTPTPTNTNTPQPGVTPPTDTPTSTPTNTPPVVVTLPPDTSTPTNTQVPPSGPVPIPEPVTVVLFGTGLAALSAALASRRRRED